jgi:hypothetical protein
MNVITVNWIMYFWMTTKDNESKAQQNGRVTLLQYTQGAPALYFDTYM